MTQAEEGMTQVMESMTNPAAKPDHIALTV